MAPGGQVQGGNGARRPGSDNQHVPDVMGRRSNRLLPGNRFDRAGHPQLPLPAAAVPALVAVHWQNDLIMPPNEKTVLGSAVSLIISAMASCKNLLVRARRATRSTSHGIDSQRSAAS